LSTPDTTRGRFAKTADRIGELQDARAADLAERVRRFVLPQGDERVLDSGTGAGALALALAPFVREVVGVDVVPEMLEQARKRAAAVPNVTFVEGDATKLPFEPGSFDLACSVRTLHHIARPELAVAELARVTRPGGHVFVVDQIAPVDPLVALELNRFERSRDPSHARTLADNDVRHLFEANGLMLERSEFAHERRELEAYLDLAGCEGEQREQAKALAPPEYTAEVGWYLFVKPAV
jgi:ubiquinone/menaquinone biosynthesis C-methylase UbiE